MFYQPLDEDLGLKSLLIATIISMGFVRYLHTSKESALNENRIIR
jgi:hypothetical protein